MSTAAGSAPQRGIRSAGTGSNPSAAVDGQLAADTGTTFTTVLPAKR